MICLCGCGQAVKNKPGGRQRKFINATHRKRYNRDKKRGNVTPTPKRDTDTDMIERPYIFLGIALTEWEMGVVYHVFDLNRRNKRATNPGSGLAYVFEQLFQQAEYSFSNGAKQCKQ